MSELTPNPAGLGAERIEKDADFGRGGKGRKRRKVSYLTTQKIDTVDYKDTVILKRFLNDRGKIVPARQSGNTASQQRMISEAIRRAREMALLPFVVTEMSADRRDFAPRRERFGGARNEGPIENPVENPQ